MFYHYLLNRKEDEMILKVLMAQKDDPIKADWFSTVTKDLQDFGLSHLEIEDIKNMKKETFKNIVREVCKNFSLKNLLEKNDQKTKLKLLKYYQLKTQSYLISPKISTRTKKCLFKFRTQMINVGSNYGRNEQCPLCKLNETYTQQHLFNCMMIKLKSVELYNMCDEKYEDIFSSNLEKLIKVSKICTSIEKIRKEIVGEK